MRISVLKFSLLVLLCAAIQVSAQQTEENPLMPHQERRPIFLGPVFGYNRSMHSASLKTYPDYGNVNNDPCPTFVNPNDNGFYVGFSYEQLLGDYKNSNSSIIARIMYQTMPSYKEVGGRRYPQVVDIIDPNTGISIGQQTVYSTLLNTDQISYSMVTLDVVYKINPFEGMTLGFTIGPTFDYILTKTWDQRVLLVEPRNAQFQIPDTIPPGVRYINNNRTIVIKEGDIPNSSSFRFGIKAAVQYEILMGSFYFVPTIAYNFGITDVASDQTWRVSALQIGMDIRYAWRR